MVDVSRLVQTWSPAISRAATGYLIGERLVLTAWHATGDRARPDDDGLQVRVFDPYGRTRWLRASRIWPAAAPDIDGRPDLDVALVRIDDPDWAPRPGLEPVRFGRITGTRAIPCRAVGFPRAEARPHDLRGTKDIAGRSEPLTALGQGLIVFTVTTSTPTARDGWAGGSGAALHSGNLIIGVLVEDRRADYPGSQLRAVDLAHLAGHTDLPRALHAAGVNPTFHDTAPRRPKAALVITAVALAVAVLLAFLPHNHPATNERAAGPPPRATTSPAPSVTTASPVPPGELPDPCQAASTLELSGFGVGAGKPSAGTGGSGTKSCEWATVNGTQRSYRLIGLSYVVGKGPLPAGFTPAPVSLPDGLLCQVIWTTSFGAIVVMVGADTHAPAGTTPDLCTVAEGWAEATFPNLPG
jgi:hypothetical protein